MAEGLTVTRMGYGAMQLAGPRVATILVFGIVMTA